MRLVLAALLALLAVPVQAQPAPPSPGTAVTTPPAPRRGQPRQSLQQRFDEANTTHDGKLTLDQAKSGRLTRVATHFDAIDAGKRGFVTMDDIHAYNRAQRAARKPKAQ